MLQNVPQFAICETHVPFAFCLESQSLVFSKDKLGRRGAVCRFSTMAGACSICVMMHLPRDQGETLVRCSRHFAAFITCLEHVGP